MKKAILFLFLLAGTYSVCQAQLYIGGGISYTTNSEGYTEGLSRDNDYSTLSINPKIGYIFNDRWNAGIYFSFSQNDYKLISDTNTEDRDYSSWGISPFVRYTCFSKKGFSLDIDGRLNYTNIHSSSDYEYHPVVDEDKYTLNSTSRTNQYGISFSPVFVYDFSRHFRIETSLTLFSLSYNDTDYTYTTTREGSSNQKSEQSGFKVSLLGDGHVLNNISLAMVYKF